MPPIQSGQNPQAPLKMMPYGNAWYEINFDASSNKFTNDEQAITSRNQIVEFIDEIPKSNVGKILRRQLRERTSHA